MERDGKGWKDMERDGKIWKEMNRDGNVWKGIASDIWKGMESERKGRKEKKVKWKKDKSITEKYPGKRSDRNRGGEKWEMRTVKGMGWRMRKGERGKEGLKGKD